MQDTKNLIMAIVLSSITLFCWQYFYATPKLVEAQKQAKLLQEQNAEKLAVKPDLNQAGQEATPAMQERTEVIKKVSRIQINTPKLHGSISLKGARFDDLTLSEYKETEEPDSKEVALLSPSGSENVYFAEFGWLGADKNTAVPDAQTIWHSSDTKLEVGKPVTLSWDNNKGLKFLTIINIDENYMFEITRKVENYGKTSESILPYGILNRSTPAAHKAFYILHEGPLGVFDGVLNEVTYANLKKENKQEIPNSTGWLGITDKYWLTAIIPDQNDSFSTNFNYFHLNNQDRFQADYLGQKYSVEPGKNLEINSHLFTGAKKLTLLDKYGKDLGIPLFDRAVDFGSLYFITKPIFKLLTYFNHLLGNFGLAILLLTVTIKAMMFPLANKSYVSMHHLKRLQPQLTEVKERYKSDKQQMNKAIMELYKTERVNPMAGCLPLLIQIPIFFALYKVLFITIEMRHAPFYGWIKDLSAPDPTSLFNLFGLLPFTPPAMLMIGAWPIIMGITMYMQQKMNPKPADPVQAKVMQMLPFIFVFLFATFPAGLIIYWAWNNILSVLQQWVITRRLPQ